MTPAWFHESLIPQQPLYLLGPLFAISLWTVKPTFRREREPIQLKTQVPGESLENLNSDDYRMSYQLSIEEDSDATNLFDQSPAHASHGEGALNAFNMNLTRGKGQEASNRHVLLSGMHNSSSSSRGQVQHLYNVLPDGTRTERNQANPSGKRMRYSLSVRNRSKLISHWKLLSRILI